MSKPSDMGASSSRALKKHDKDSMRRLLLLLAAFTLEAQAATPRTIQSFDSNWRFSLSDPAEAQTATFNDKQWQTVTVPHDWSIAGPILQNAPKPSRRRILPHRHRLVPQDPDPPRPTKRQAHLHRLRRRHRQLRRLLQRNAPRPPSLRHYQLLLRPDRKAARWREHHRRPRR